jgi:hypothetical protein
MKSAIVAVALIALFASAGSATFYGNRTFETMTPEERQNYSASSYARGCIDAAIHDYRASGHESIRVGIIDEITAQCHSDAVEIARKIEQWLNHGYNNN